MQNPALALAKAVVLIGIAFAVATVMVILPSVTQAQTHGLTVAGHPTSWARLF